MKLTFYVCGDNLGQWIQDAGWLAVSIFALQTYFRNDVKSIPD